MRTITRALWTLAKVTLAALVAVAIVGSVAGCTAMQGLGMLFDDDE